MSWWFLFSGCSQPPQPPLAEKLETAISIVFTEGPAVDAEGNVFFTEIRGNRILKWGVDNQLSVYREPSRRANGLAIDAQGRLVACEGAGMGDAGGRQVTRTDLKTGQIQVLAERFEGKRLNSPNDLALDPQGRIYFSDPRYGDQSGRELETEDVYRIELDGRLTRVLTKPDIEKPNGLEITPDGKTLYIADTTAGPPTERRIKKFTIEPDGRVTSGSVHYSFGGGRGADGMTLDEVGNLYAAAGSNTNAPENRAGIYIISQQGKLLEVIPIPEDAVTNCAFGGPDRRTLYVTAGKNLYKVRTRHAGARVGG